MINKYKNIFFTAIVLIGLILRFYDLGGNPPSLNWDEASTAYNAYSIYKTGRDEYGNFLPLSIRSFDDYKPALYTYLTVPFVAMFDLSELSVRLPSAILGTLSIVLLYYLILEIFSPFKKKQELSLLGAFIFAISPWSLQFSRAAYEGNIGLFFLLGGILFLLKAFKKNWFLYLSSVFFVLAMYSYHSFRLVVPLLVIVIALLFYKKLLSIKKTLILSILIFIILIVPIFYSFATKSGTGSRLSMVTIFGNPQVLDHSISQLNYDKSKGDIIGTLLHNRRVVYFLNSAKGYLDHYNPDFLFFNGDSGRQHHAVDMGMLYLIELPFILLGFIYLTRNLNRRALLLFGLIAVAPIPSAITTGTPHPVRAIAMLPVFVILSAVGVVWFFELIEYVKKRYFKRTAIAGLIFFFALNVTYYLHQYYIHTPYEYGDFWQYGYKEAFEIAKSKEDEVDKIVMTAKYDQPYIYYLFYNKIDPSWYQKNWDFTGTGVMPRFERKIGKYEFRFIKLGDEAKYPNTLIIGGPDEVYRDAKLPKGTKFLPGVYFLDGSAAFNIIQTRYVPKN